MDGELLDPDLACRSGRKPAGLEPATSWVRSRFGAVRPVHGCPLLLTNFPISSDFSSLGQRELHAASLVVAHDLCQKRVTPCCPIR
jgi:hypothetical protein